MAISKYFDAVSKTAVICLVLLNLTQKQYQDVQPELIQHQSNFILINRNVCKKMKPACFALWPETPNQGQGHRKWYKMAEVKGAYKPATWLLHQRSLISNHPPPPPENFPLMTTALKDLTLKAARHWVVNLILRICIQSL